MTYKTQFVCFLWGDIYPESYVERLYNSVKLYFTHDFTFHCFSDKKLNINSNIIQHEIILGSPFYGNWNKERVFSSGFLNLPDGVDIVIMDIDILVTGSLNFLIEEKPNEPLVMAPDGYKSRKGAGHGSVYRVKANSLPHIWNDLINADYDSLIKIFGSEREQRWLDRYFPANKVSLFSEGKVVSYKYHCSSKGLAPFGKKAAFFGLTNALWSKALLPEDARVVCFHGKPDLEDVENTNYGRWKHAPFIRNALSMLPINNK